MNTSRLARGFYYTMKFETMQMDLLDYNSDDMGTLSFMFHSPFEPGQCIGKILFTSLRVGEVRYPNQPVESNRLFQEMNSCPSVQKVEISKRI
jgi:hypothetical protein